MWKVQGREPLIADVRLHGVIEALRGLIMMKARRAPTGPCYRMRFCRFVVWLSVGVGLATNPSISESREPEQSGLPAQKHLAAKIVLAADLEPDEIERLLVIPVTFELLRLNGVKDITAISQTGLSELYIEASPELSVQEFSEIVIKNLPSLDLRSLNIEKAVISSFQILPNFEGVPPVGKEKKTRVRVEANQKAVANFGIHVHAITEALKANATPPGEPVTPQTVEFLRRQTISLTDGRKIPLSEVASFTLEETPSHRIYKTNDTATQRPQTSAERSDAADSR